MKYGKLTFISDSGKNKHGQLLWRLRCDCGVDCVKVASSVRTGHTKSCGCERLSGLGNFRHGKRSTKEYTAWLNMHRRCKDKNSKHYKNYGGRGLLVDKRWDNFTDFLRDVGEAPGPQYTLDRVDNEMGYFPGNVRWAPRAVQSRNKREKKMPVRLVRCVRHIRRVCLQAS